MLSVLLAFLCLSRCYLLPQGLVIFSHQVRAKDIARVLENEDLSDDVRGFLELVLDVKDYAVNTIGLKDDGNYTTFVATDRDYLADVVSACARDRFEAYTWKYPLFGSFPYKGFFEREEALREARRLEERDLDVIVRKVDAFSTLGFFSDPVYSFMKDYHPYTLASLIIHEQTHATIFLKDRIQFNEELAMFVGRLGGLSFVADTYGIDSEHYRYAVDYLKDLDLFVTLIHDLRNALDDVYQETAPSQSKLERKQQILASFREALATNHAGSFATPAFANIGTMALNNATIMSLMRYTENIDIFYRVHETFGGDLRRTMDFLKTLKNSHDDPRAQLELFLDEQKR